MKAYSHPDLEEVPLHAVMQALADPCRVEIVRELLRANGRSLACNEVELDVCKATRSHHFEVLRNAGIIYTESEGTKCLTSLRRTELNRRFPGLLQLVARSELKEARKHSAKPVNRGGKRQGAAGTPRHCRDDGARREVRQGMECGDEIR